VTTVQTTIEAVDAIIADKSLLKHPFYQAWNAGELSLADLRRYAAQYFHFEAAFPTFLSAVHARCESPAVRQAVLNNLWDEEHGPDNHVALWLRFCEGLGLSEAEVRATEPLPETVDLVEGFRAACSGSTAAGIATIYAYESQAPEVARQKIAGLKQFYAIEDARTLSFFSLHADLDVEHAAAERAVIEAAAPAEREAVEAAVGDATARLWRFLDGAYALRGSVV
jgi:pyrroloquinoline-quinone synthase